MTEDFQMQTRLIKSHKICFFHVNSTFIHLFSHVNKKRQHEKKKFLSLESVDFTFPHNTNVNVWM